MVIHCKSTSFSPHLEVTTASEIYEPTAITLCPLLIMSHSEITSIFCTPFECLIQICNWIPCSLVLNFHSLQLLILRELGDVLPSRKGDNMVVMCN
jgi:hypothetical protein